MTGEDFTGDRRPTEEELDVEEVEVVCLDTKELPEVSLRSCHGKKLPSFLSLLQLAFGSNISSAVTHAINVLLFYYVQLSYIILLFHSYCLRKKVN